MEAKTTGFVAETRKVIVDSHRALPTARIIEFYKQGCDGNSQRHKVCNGVHWRKSEDSGEK